MCCGVRLLSLIGLARNQFKVNGVVKERKKPAMISFLFFS